MWEARATDEACGCLKWFPLHVHSGGHNSGDNLLWIIFFCILWTWMMFLFWCACVRLLRSRRVGVPSWATGVFIGWECGCVNVLAAIPLFLLSIQGFFLSSYSFSLAETTKANSSFFFFPYHYDYYYDYYYFKFLEHSI